VVLTKKKTMIDLIKSAVNKETNEDYTVFLQGDLCQMSNLKKFLQSRGFDIKQNDVYPCLKKSDAKRALELIYKNRVDGWWNNWNEIIKLGIATEADRETWRKS
jgi:hypothetical protein